MTTPIHALQAWQALRSHYLEVCDHAATATYPDHPASRVHIPTSTQPTNPLAALSSELQDQLFAFLAQEPVEHESVKMEVMWIGYEKEGVKKMEKAGTAMKGKGKGRKVERRSCEIYNGGKN